jgi:hypothetical protein
VSNPPPADLERWSRPMLVREVERLRSIVREHAESPGSDPRQAATDSPITDLANDLNARGGVLLDVRKAVHMDTVDVSLVDEHGGADSIFAFLVLAGRINYATDRVNHAYLLSADGAAGIVSEITALAIRANTHPDTAKFATDFKEAVDRRMEELT